MILEPTSVVQEFSSVHQVSSLKLEQQSFTPKTKNVPMLITVAIVAGVFFIVIDGGLVVIKF